LAGGGAAALRGVFSEHTLRSAFASGLNAALVVAGLTGIVAGALVLILVRQPRAAVVQPAPEVLEKTAAPS
ncbi:MFS transporter, partial [Streptomyces sp. NPDC001640]